MNKSILIIKKELSNYNEIVACYLFGSYAKGEQKKTSDIDIAILLNKNFKIPKFYLSEISNILEKKIKKEIHISILKEGDIIFTNQVLKYGKKLFSKINTEEFENISLKRYLDFKYYFDIYNNERIKRIES